MDKPLLRSRSRRPGDKIKTVKLGMLILFCGLASLIFYYAWKATSFPHLSETDLDRLVDLPYLAYESSKQVSHLAAATRTSNVDDDAGRCTAHLNLLVTESAVLTLAWHSHTTSLIHAIDNTDFRTANTTITTVLSSLATIETSTSAALTACRTFFATLDTETHNLPLVTYRINDRTLQKGLAILPHVRRLWGPPANANNQWCAATYLTLRLRCSARALDMPFRFLWQLTGLPAQLRRNADIVEKLVEARQTAYRARVGDSLERMRREVEDAARWHRDRNEKRRSWMKGWGSWVWGGVGTRG